MSLFRPYASMNKQRPDLPEGAPVKNGFFRFWELYFRKFWRFLSINIYYFLITLPFLAYVFFTVNGFFAERLEAMGGNTVVLAGVNFLVSLFDFVPRQLYIPLLIISAVLYGPATMGVTYIFRNFAREEHAWLSDMFSRAVSNFRQGLVFGLLDILITYLLISGMFGNIAQAGKTIGYSLSVILSSLCVLAFIIWLFMRHYTYMTAVTVNLSVFAILKNAWLFVVLGFGRNLISGAVTLAALILCFLLAPLITIITVPLIYYSFTWFCTVFTCYPVVKKYIIVPALDAEKAKKDKQLINDSGENNEPAE
jgi:hypothetical protein